MIKLKEHHPKSFSEFLNIVLEKQSNSQNPVWFRGSGKSNYPLIPSLYRHKKIKSMEKLLELENQLLTRFKQRSIPFHDRNLEDTWNSLFVMQHYGVPTRLLDWTENPFIAFYFAVMYAERNNKGYSDSAAVWMLDPVLWNRSSLKHLSFDQGIISTVDEQINAYKPSAKFTAMNSFPVALYGAHNSSRIVAQRGVFVIFGQKNKPMETLLVEESFPQDSLVKITLNKKFLSKMKSEILNNGITESVVFPDLEGLAKEIRRIYGFED
jgi:hypothetical protein